MHNIRCRIKDYIQPFERTLALQELSALGTLPATAGHDKSFKTEFYFSTPLEITDIASRLAYWEMISSDSHDMATVQSRREATVNIVRNGIDLVELKRLLPFSNDIPFPNRRCLRYGTHGIHEYRGKFFPQLVRSLINISGTKPGGIIADPMSGSGTAIVEGVLFGCEALGLDMNPLSVFLGNTKCQLLSADTNKLESAYTTVRAAVLAPEARGKRKLEYLSSLPEPDQIYLKNWFAEEVLHALDEIAIIIQGVRYEPARNLMWVSLSNILRSVSWQKEDDLRVRKDVRLDVEIDPKKEFLEELARSIRAVLAFLYQEGQPPAASHSIISGDARTCGTTWKDYQNKVDVVITSPPYATALPYLDTDRLSLCYLGLLPRPEHRSRDQMMIGNREVTDKMKREYLTTLESQGHLLPTSVRTIIREIESLNNGTDAGFRRKNLPALLAKYFFDMRLVLKGILEILKPGGNAFIVVGNNHTIAGGKRVDIETAGFLAEIAKQLGFELSPSLPMDMLVSRDIFRSNAMATEEILYLKKPD